MTETQHISFFNRLHRQNSTTTEAESAPNPSLTEAENQAKPVPGRLHMNLAEDENTFLVGVSSLGDLPRDRHTLIGSK